jgi:hypothetical protein
MREMGEEIEAKRVATSCICLMPPSTSADASISHFERRNPSYIHHLFYTSGLTPIHPSINSVSHQ